VAGSTGLPIGEQREKGEKGDGVLVLVMRMA
jgi:hypothetical protein